MALDAGHKDDQVGCPLHEGAPGGHSEHSRQRAGSEFVVDSVIIASHLSAWRITHRTSRRRCCTRWKAPNTALTKNEAGEGENPDFA